MDKVGKIVEYVQYLIDIYEDIYNNILGPQITNILSWLWKKIVDEIIREAIERLLLYIQKWILDGVEFVEDISRYLMGFKDMTVTSGATRSSDSFLYHVFQFPAIEKIYFGMGMISIPLIMMLTVYKMLPLINEERDRNPISTALRRSAGAFSRILTLWVACTFFLHAGVALTSGILCAAPDNGGRMADIMFVSAMAGFARGDRGAIAEKYLDRSDSTHTYGNISQVAHDFDKPGIVWFVIYYVEIRCLLVVLGLSYSAAKRGLGMIAIYVCGPVLGAVSMDQPELFKRYKRYFASQFLSFMGAALSLTAFYLIATYIGAADIAYSGSAKVDAVLRCLIILLFIKSISQVSDMTVSILSGVGFSDYARSEAATTKAVISVIKIVKEVVIAVATGGGSLALKAGSAGSAGALGGLSGAGGLGGLSGAGGLGGLDSIKGMDGLSKGIGQGKKAGMGDLSFTRGLSGPQLVSSGKLGTMSGQSGGTFGQSGAMQGKLGALSDQLSAVSSQLGAKSSQLGAMSSKLNAMPGQSGGTLDRLNATSGLPLANSGMPGGTLASQAVANTQLGASGSSQIVGGKANAKSGKKNVISGKMDMSQPLQNQFDQSNGVKDENIDVNRDTYSPKLSAAEDSGASNGAKPENEGLEQEQDSVYEKIWQAINDDDDDDDDDDENREPNADTSGEPS